MVEGFYHRPILAENVFFGEDEIFRKWAVLDAEYTLSEDIIKKKSKFDLFTPKINEIFDDEKNDIEDSIQLDQYMSTIFDEVAIEKNKKEKFFAKNKKTEVKINNDTDDDWWLGEDAFDMEKNDKKNPFGVKK